MGATTTEEIVRRTRLQREALLLAMLLAGVNIVVLLLRRHTDLDNAPQFRRLFDIALEAVVVGVFNYRITRLEPRRHWHAGGWLLLGVVAGGVAYQALRLLDRTLPGLLSVGALVLAAGAGWAGFVAGRESRTAANR